MKDMTVDELIGTEVFRDEVKKQLEMEKASHKEAAVGALMQGVRLKRSPFDSLTERGIMDDADEVVRLFRGILQCAVVGLSSAERRYIADMCYLAGKRAVLRIKDEEEQEPGGANNP